MRGWRLAVAALCFIAGGAAGPHAAMAQAFPSRHIDLIVPLAPGSTTDVAARVFAQKVSQSLGVQVVIDNRPGAGSMLGSSIVAKAKPDGHTLLFGAIGLAINPLLYASVPYDTLKDFAPVSLMVTAPMIMLVHPGIGVGTLPEFLSKYKDSKDLSYASAGPGTLPHLAGELLRVKSGIPMRHVPYKGGAPALNDVVAGHVPINFGTPGTKSVIDSGKVRALAIASPKRIEVLPDVPTFAEQGLPIPELDGGAWFGVLAPAGTPADAIETLSQHFRDTLKDPQVRAQLAQVGFIGVGNTPAEFSRFIKDEIERWPAVFREAGIGRAH